MDIRVLEATKEFELLCPGSVGGCVEHGYTSDLLSDVLANAEENSVLITLQAHKNSIAVASIAGATAVIFCTEREIEQDVIAAAEESEIALFQTKLNQFETSVLIGKLLEANS